MRERKILVTILTTLGLLLFFGIFHITASPSRIDAHAQGSLPTPSSSDHYVYLPALGGKHASISRYMDTTDYSRLYDQGPAPGMSRGVSSSPPIEYYMYLPIAIDETPPLSSTSRYLTDTDPNYLLQVGCDEGERITGVDNIGLVLSFGQPWRQGDVEGILLHSNWNFRSTVAVSDSVEAYISGFYWCSPAVSLTLGVGLNNFGPAQYVSFSNGAAWAGMVNDINRWTRSYGYQGKVQVWGAIDIEGDTIRGWNNYTDTLPWIQGYDSAFDPTLGSFYANYGSCDSCPFTNHLNNVPLGFTVAQLYYVSYQARPAYPLPEIYLRTYWESGHEYPEINADQWWRISSYGATTYGVPMRFQGSMTQWAACLQNPSQCDPSTQNTPEEGWTGLYTWTKSDIRTSQVLTWSTDIRWP